MKKPNSSKFLKCYRLMLAVLFLAFFVPCARALTLTLPGNPSYSFITTYIPAGSPLETVFTCLQFGDTVGLWDCGSGEFDYYIYAPGFNDPGTVWVDPIAFNDIASPLSPGPGVGVVYQNEQGTPETLTLSGTGSGPAPFPCGSGTFSLVSCTTPNAADYADIVGASPVNGSQMALWNGTGFNLYTYFGCSGWEENGNPVTEPTVPAGSSVFISVPVAPLTGMYASIEGLSVTAPGFTLEYTLTVNNYGPASSSPDTLTVSGIPAYMTLTSPLGSTLVSGGFQVGVPALACGQSVTFSFSLTCANNATAGSSFTLTPSLIVNSSTPVPLTVNVVASLDPNSKSGPAGIGPHHYLVGTPPLPYNITFENDPAASAPAQRVVITDQLDPTTMSFGSFQFGPITFGSEVVTPTPGVNPYSHTVLSYNAGGNIINVRINATNDDNFLSPTFGLVTWAFQSLDPNTGLPPTNPQIGFLPPDTSPPTGQGMVTFTVNPLSSLVTGDLITNSASVVFDANSAIVTGIWTNTIIPVAPYLTISRAAAGRITITWPSWTLQEASALSGPWANSAVQVSPWTFTPPVSVKFYRLQAP